MKVGHNIWDTKYQVYSKVSTEKQIILNAIICKL